MSADSSSDRCRFLRCLAENVGVSAEEGKMSDGHGNATGSTRWGAATGASQIRNGVRFERGASLRAQPGAKDLADAVERNAVRHHVTLSKLERFCRTSGGEGARTLTSPRKRNPGTLEGARKEIRFACDRFAARF
jgi:hypothetical protein